MSKRVQISDLVFEELLPGNDITLRIQQLADRMNADLREQVPILMPVLNGGFWFASQLMTRLRIGYQLDCIRVGSWHGGTQSSGQVDMMLRPSLDLKDRTVIVLEDIVDTGNTLDYLMTDLEPRAGRVLVYSLFTKPEAFVGQREADWVGHELPNVFVVGCGMDYQEQGRHLNDLYQKTDVKPSGGSRDI